VAFKYGESIKGKRLHICTSKMSRKSWCGYKLINVSDNADGIICEKCLASLSRFVTLTRWRMNQIRHFAVTTR
jgi:hypothetical protein